VAWQEPGSTDHAQLQKIRSLLFADLMRVPPGKQISKNAFTWNGDGTLATLKAYDGAELLFTLTFSWNVAGTLSEVART
jgi:hypothetical protein